MGKKGMSLDDKRATVLKLLQESRRPFTLKDVERIAGKAGVVQNTVKDVLKDLTDDNLVDMDKIGSSNWFWAFPSKSTMFLANKAKALETKLKQLDDETTSLLEREQELNNERPQTDARKAKVQEYEALGARKAELQSKLQFAQENDPAEMQKLQKQIEEAKKSANLWTDNTWACQDWLKKKFGASKQDCMRQLGITEDFDYPAYRPPK